MDPRVSMTDCRPEWSARSDRIMRLARRRWCLHPAYRSSWVRMRLSTSAVTRLSILASIRWSISAPMRSTSPLGQGLVISGAKILQYGGRSGDLSLVICGHEALRTSRQPLP